MAIRKIAQMGHPVLRKRGRELSAEEIQSEPIQRLIDDMLDTMHEYGGLGLAAPQVHESLQLAIIEFGDDNGRYPDMGDQPLLVIINPKVTVLSTEEQGFWEGCLSVPDLRGLVYRPEKIEVEFLDREGKARKIVAEDFLATVFQHELDHLEGVLYVDRIRNEPGKTPIAFLEEYRKYLVPEQEEDSDLEV